ncbi:MAG: hypothetical protein ACMXYK_03515 [Candidatus Woesearchaeota archaeon]
MEAHNVENRKKFEYVLASQKKKSLLTYVSKKSQAQLLFNVIVGVIVIVILLVTFIIISASMGNLKHQDVKDIEYMIVADSFIPMLGELDRATYESFLDISSDFPGNYMQGIFTRVDEFQVHHNRPSEEQKVFYLESRTSDVIIPHTTRRGQETILLIPSLSLIARNEFDYDLVTFVKSTERGFVGIALTAGIPWYGAFEFLFKGVTHTIESGSIAHKRTLYIGGLE